MSHDLEPFPMRPRRGTGYRLAGEDRAVYAGLGAHLNAVAQFDMAGHPHLPRQGRPFAVVDPDTPTWATRREYSPASTLWARCTRLSI